MTSVERSLSDQTFSLRNVPVETLRTIASTLMYQPVLVTVSIRADEVLQ